MSTKSTVYISKSDENERKKDQKMRNRRDQPVDWDTNDSIVKFTYLVIYLWFLWHIFSRSGIGFAFLPLDLPEFFQNLRPECILLINLLSLPVHTKFFHKIQGLAAARECCRMQIACGISDDEDGFILVQELPRAIGLHPIFLILSYNFFNGLVLCV